MISTSQFLRFHLFMSSPLEPLYNRLLLIFSVIVSLTEYTRGSGGDMLIRATFGTSLQGKTQKTTKGLESPAVFSQSITQPQVGFHSRCTATLPAADHVFLLCPTLQQILHRSVLKKKIYFIGRNSL